MKVVKVHKLGNLETDMFNTMIRNYKNTADITTGSLLKTFKPPILIFRNYCNRTCPKDELQS